MATIAASIALMDKFTPVTSSIIRGMNSVISSMERMDKASQNCVDIKAIAAAKTEFGRAGAAVKQFEEEIARAAKKQDSLSRATTNSIASSNGLISSLKGVAATIATVVGIDKLLNMSDTYSQTTARVNLMNDGMQTTAALQGEIYQAALNSHGAYQSTADAVSKLGIMAGSAFSSSGEIVDFAEQLNKQFIIGGTNIQGQEAAMLQLTQAMASGVLRGDELNSVYENAPLLIKSMADYMGVPVEQMRGLAEQGLITTDVMKNGVLNAAEQTNARFASMGVTFSQVWTDFKTKSTRAWVSVNKGLNSLANSPGLTTFTDNIVSGIENLTPAIVNMVSRFVDFANNPDVQNLFSGVIQGASQLIGFVIDATVNVASFIGSFAGIDGIATSVGVLAGGFVAVKAAMVGMGAVNGIMGLIETLGAGAAGATGVSGIGAAFTALAGPVGIAIAAVTAISAVLVGAYNSSETFRNSIGTAFESIGQTAQAAFDKVAVAFVPVLPVFEHFGTAVNPILKQIGDVMGNYVVPAITFMVNTFITGFANLVTLFAPFLSALGNVFSFIGNGVGAVCALLNGDWSGAWLFAQQMCQNACDFVTNILSGFWGMLTTIIGGIATTVYDGFMNSWNFVTSIGGMIVDSASSAFWAVINGAGDVLGNLLTTVSTGFEPALAWVQELPGKFLQWGRDMIQQLIDGVRNMAGGAVDAVGSIVTDIVNRFRDGFGIHSPSTIMYEIGSYLMQGLVNSVLDSNIMTFFNGIIEDIKAAFAGGNFGIKTFIDFVGGGAAEFLKSIGIGGATLGNLVTPVAGAVTSGFGSRDAFMTDSGQMSSSYHEGIDIGAAYGDAVGAAGAGTVTMAGWNGGYGNTVKIDHGNGLVSMYAHLDSIAVSVGAMVSKMQTIGLVGSTGNSTGAHLHFGLYQDGTAIDPGSLFGYANGTNFARSGPHWVGENGPEILNFAGGEKVLDAEKSKALVSSAGSKKSTVSGKPIVNNTVNVNLSGVEVKNDMDIKKIANGLADYLEDMMVRTASGIYIM